jgi:hypothetical protein
MRGFSVAKPVARSIKSASLLAAFLACLSAIAVRADDGARKYAVLSLIGESMTVVGYVAVTGVNLNRNRSESVSVGSKVFDTTALGAVQESLRRVDSQAPIALFLGTSPALFTEQAKLFDGPRVLLSPELGAAMKKDGATHLVLVTRYRSEALIRGAYGNHGSGTLEGLGFYVDNDLRTISSSDGGAARGFLAPYVYLRVSLVDLATSMIDREELITWSIMLSAARSDSGDPRDVLAGKRLSFLLDALTRQIKLAVPALVRAPDPSK